MDTEAHSIKAKSPCVHFMSSILECGKFEIQGNKRLMININQRKDGIAI